MNSVDTNVLVHALDGDSPLHEACLPVYQRLMRERNGWVVADQVLFELYRLLRNPVVFQHPLTTARAARVIEQIRDRSGALHCAYEARHWPKVLDLLRRFPDRKGVLVFDAVLAVALHGRGVTTFYTRNSRDFGAFGLFEVIDPTVA